jgi:hypothetical protein
MYIKQDQKAKDAETIDTQIIGHEYVQEAGTLMIYRIFGIAFKKLTYYDLIVGLDLKNWENEYNIFSDRYEEILKDKYSNLNTLCENRLFVKFKIPEIINSDGDARLHYPEGEGDISFGTCYKMHR